QAFHQSKDHWSITMFSTGTNGKPKSITHSWLPLIRNVKVSSKHQSNVWGLAYNPTHIAGVQVILQALLNGNTIVRLFGLSSEGIIDSIRGNNPTHISATSSFYRILLPLSDILPSVRRITFGGEKMDLSVVEALKINFPHAKFLNLYASTELGTVLSSQSDIFTIDETNISFVKIEQGILWIHTSKLPNANVSEDDWYNTEDRVEVLSSHPLQFRFMGRQADVVNIGGYNVYLHEVKDALLSLEGIKDARLYSKPNKLLGNILLCDIATDNQTWTEVTIRKQLQLRLVEYKIPRIFNFYTHLPLGRTGKGSV
ncbi:MAG TPA: AMP-binding protein, partial [Saprospiraceae bacterium]|nr:AMP-binding protein [Saprospiraceae bacterium]